MEKDISGNGNQGKRAVVGMLISDKINFKMVKRQIYQECITFVNICILNNRAPKNIKQKPTDKAE